MTEEECQFFQISPGTYFMVVARMAMPTEMLTSVKLQAAARGIDLIICRVHGGVDSVRLIRAEEAETIKVVEGE